MWYYVGIRGNEQHVVYVSVENNTTCAFRSDGAVVPRPFPCTPTYTPELHFEDTILIYDGTTGGVEAVVGKSRAIIFASANLMNCKSVAKVVAAHLTFVSPSFNEFSRAYQLFQSHEMHYEGVKVDHLWYFEHSGTSLRNMLKNPEYVLSSLTVAAHCVKLDNLRSSSLGKVDNDTPSSLFVTFLKSENLQYLLETPVEMAQLDFKEVFQKMLNSSVQDIANLKKAYVFGNVEWNICSEYVYDLIQKYSEDKIEDFNARFVEVSGKSATLGAMRGNMFQTRLPKVFGRQGCSYEVRTLKHSKSQRNEAATVQNATFQVENLTYLKTTDVNEILRTCLDPKTLYVINGQLPAFDMFIPPNVFIQITCVRTTRHPINFDAAVKICEHCAANNCRALFLFAVPRDTFELWKYSQPFSAEHLSCVYDNLDPVCKTAVERLDQYTLCIVNL